MKVLLSVSLAAALALVTMPVRAQEVPIGPTVVRAAPPALADSLPAPLPPRDAIRPDSALVPAMLAGAVVGALMMDTDPECAPSSSRLQSAAIGAVWGGIWRLLRGDDTPASPGAREEERLPESFCGEESPRSH